jgi:hypothetical protein
MGELIGLLVEYAVTVLVACGLFSRCPRLALGADIEPVTTNVSDVHSSRSEGSAAMHNRMDHYSASAALREFSWARRAADEALCCNNQSGGAGGTPDTAGNRASQSP